MILQKMPLKIINSKFIIRVILLVCLVSFNFGNAQEIIEDESDEMTAPKEVIAEQEGSKKVNDSVTFTPLKVDGVAAVVGDYIILESDVDKQLLQLKAQGISTADITHCQMFGKLLEDKLYAHHAIQDSIVVSDAEIRSYVDQQIQAFLQQANGSIEEI